MERDSNLSADSNREARSPASGHRSSGENRARSSGRSQSRGRSNPSELLARKQLLLATSSSAAGTATKLAPEPGNEAASGGQLDSPVSNGSRLTAAAAAAAALADSSVEAKLESLSELLKSHQQQSESQLVANQSNHLQLSQTTPTPAKSIDDVYILLAKKEKDLQLAAELGKVLLEKNDELSKANERITENYSHKLELLEQDKHKLKRKLDLLDSEYENRLIELQTDCNILKNQLDEQQQVARQTEKEKSKLIDDLVQQNQRLTSELVEATKSEELLSSQLERMNERLNNGASNRQDHFAQLDTLKEEIQIVNQRKLDLERRLKLANNDKSNLAAALDESGDKILLLEKLLNERDANLLELTSEVNELRDSSAWLSNELESMLSLNERLVNESLQDTGSRDAGIIIDGVATSGNNNNELHNASQRKRSQLIEQLRELRLKHRSRIRAREFKLVAETERIGDGLDSGGSSRRRQEASRRNRKLLAGSRRRALAARQQLAAKGSSSLFDEIESSNRWSQDDDDDGHYELDEDDDNASQAGDLAQRTDEIVAEIYLLLHRFHSNLLLRKEELLMGRSTASSSSSSTSTSSSRAPASQQAAQQQQHLYSAPNSPDDSGISADDGQADKTNALGLDQVAWKRLLGSLKALIEEMPCSNCRLMIAERADYEQLQKLHAKLSDELRKKDDQLLALSIEKTEQETRLAALEERCNILSNDLSNCDKPKEEIVKLAWKARDEAVERKNAAEISLAKTRIENMQISSQLMEVVQQKGELSQRLAQFEDDIHYITQDSVKAKFTWEEYAEKLRKSKASRRQDTATSVNPLVQLLGFSVASANRSGSANAGASAIATGTTNSQQQQQQQQDKSSAMDNLVGQPSSLMRNFTSNRFNLRFWQRNSSEKAADKGALISANFNNNNNNNIAAEHKVS